MSLPTRLIFIYNANSGQFSGLRNTLHKVVSPQTYACGLCALTYGFLAEKKAWKHFRNTSEVAMVFLHKDEFLKQYRSKWLQKYDFPVILSEEDGKLEIFINSEEIGQMENLSEFIRQVKLKLK